LPRLGFLRGVFLANHFASTDSKVRSTLYCFCCCQLSSVSIGVAILLLRILVIGLYVFNSLFRSDSTESRACNRR